MASGIWPEVPCHVCKTQEGLRAVLNIEIWPPATLIRAAETDSETKKGGASPVWCPTRSTAVHGRLIIIWMQE